MREFKILNESVKTKLQSDIFSAVEVLNQHLSTYLIIDHINFYDTFVSVVVGTTDPNKFVTSVEVNALCRYISDIFIKLSIVTFSSCRFIAIDFENSVFTLAVNL